MVKTAACIFFVLFLSVQTPLGQVFKLPLLVQHFLKHQKQTGNSLIGFVLDHYSPNHQDADQSEDEQLPFKTIVLLNVGCALVPPVITSDFTVVTKSLRKLALNDQQKLQRHLSSIFHPPCFNA